MKRFLLVIGIIAVVLFIFYLINYSFITYDSFVNKLDVPLQFYVISLRHEDRLNNIKKQQEKLSQEVIIVDAVKGDKLDLDSLVESGIVILQDGNFRQGERARKREIGCYLSHLKIYEMIIENEESGYTVIFEDDFIITSDSLIHDVKLAVGKLNERNIQFDILYLGNLQSNHGENIIDNLYYPDKNDVLYGAYGYLINNANINRIYDKTHIITKAIDERLTDLMKQGELNIALLHPNIIDPWGAQTSTINDTSIDTFKNYSLV